LNLSIQTDSARRALNSLKASGMDFADLRLVHKVSTTVSVQDGRVEEVTGGEDFGACARVLLEGAWGFSATNGVGFEDLSRILDNALRLAKSSASRTSYSGSVFKSERRQVTHRPRVEVDPREIPEEDKIDLISNIERELRGSDSKIVNSAVGYRDLYVLENIVDSLGSCVEDESIRTLISLSAVAREGSDRQSAFEILGETAGFEFVRKLDYHDVAVKTARRASSLLAAKDPPSGKFQVVLDNAVVGLFAHEAIGHNAEADAVATGESIFKDSVGSYMAQEELSIVDDPTIPNAFGSYAFDSEGIKGEKKYVIEHGRLVGLLHSLESSAHLSAKPTGNARAMDHQFLPIVRMSNTYVEPRDLSFEELVEDVDEGIYCKGGYWGYVYVERGQFTCNVAEGYMVKNGEISDHLRGFSIGGNTVEVLKNVTGIGNDMKLKLPGSCGKKGQSISVDAGGPHVRVRDMIVGGLR